MNPVFSRFILVGLLCALAAGCAGPVTKRTEIEQALIEVEAKKQRELAFKEILKDQNRLYSVAYPVLEQSAELCADDTRASLGIYFGNKYLYSEEYRDIAIAQLGLGEALQIVHVVPGSPADSAGIQVGDVLVSVNGEPAPVGDKASQELHETLKELSPDETVPVAVVRGEDKLAFDVTTKKICKYPVLLDPSDEINAYADGSRIAVTRGMMRFAQQDDELALVISHEIAHNVMDHIDKRRVNTGIGLFFDILAAAYGVDTQGTFSKVGAQAYSQGFEAEADYVGLYMLARSGHDISNAPNFWRRMAVAHPSNISKGFGLSHPSTPERFISLEREVEEIKAKLAAGQPLVPEMKEETAPDAENSGADEN